MRKYGADLALIAVTAVWGSTFVTVKNALPFASPLVFLVLRFALAGAVLGLIYGRKIELRASLVPGIVSGIFLFAGYALQTMGLVYTSPSKSAFLTTLSVPLIPFLAPLVYRKGPGKLELLGVTIATAGMVLLTIPARFSGLNRGDWLTVLCAVSFAAQAVAVSYYARRGSFEGLVLVQMATVTILALAMCNLLEPAFLHWNAGVAGAVLLTGLLATALAFSVQAWAQARIPVTRAAVIYALEPVFAWCTSFFLTGELLTRRAVFGAFLILFGILSVEVKRGRAGGHPST